MELMEQLIFYSTVAGFLSGLSVLAFGDWHKLTLKYAAVALSTATTFYLAYVSITHPGSWYCPNNTQLCDQQSLAFLMRNLAFIVFHLTTGRDAMTFKQFDRRQIVERLVAQTIQFNRITDTHNKRPKRDVI